MVGGTWPAFFSPLFRTRRWAWRKFFLAGVMPLVSMLVERLSRPAWQLLRGAAGQCGEEVEEVEVGRERAVQSRS